jgi:hypothetical protein
LAKMAADRSPNAKLGRVAAMVLLARLDRETGNGQTSSALIEEMRSLHMRQPLLLFAPNVDLGWRFDENGGATPNVDPASGGIAPMVEAGSTTRLLATDNFEDRWIDVGFWVSPDGKVGEPEILRSHGPTDWTPKLMRSIAGRAYSPIEEPTYKVERYSLTSRYMNVTGTRLRQRSPNARIEYVDLTVDPPAGTH